MKRYQTKFNLHLNNNTPEIIQYDSYRYASFVDIRHDTWNEFTLDQMTELIKAPRFITLVEQGIIEVYEISEKLTKTQVEAIS